MNEPFSNYEIIFSHKIRVNKTGPRKILGDSSSKICKFCGKTEKQVSFRQQKHIIPEMFGNRELFSNEECDECNKKYSQTIEDDFGKVMSLCRATSRIRGQQGKSSYKLKFGNSKNSIECKFDGSPIKIDCRPSAVEIIFVFQNFTIL